MTMLELAGDEASKRTWLSCLGKKFHCRRRVIGWNLEHRRSVTPNDQSCTVLELTRLGNWCPADLSDLAIRELKALSVDRDARAIVSSEGDQVARIIQAKRHRATSLIIHKVSTHRKRLELQTICRQLEPF